MPALIEIAAVPGEPALGGEGIAKRAAALAGRVMWRMGRRAARRGADAALAGLIENWHRLGGEHRAAAAGVGGARLARVAGALAASRDGEARRGAAGAARDARDAELAGLCAALLTDEQAGDTAELGLLALAVGASAPCRARVAPEEARQRLGASALGVMSGPADAIEAAVADGCERFAGHGRRGVLAAALALLDGARAHLGRTGLEAVAGERGALGAWRLGAWLERGPEESHAALRGVIRRTAMPLANRQALEWIVRPALARACGARLSRLEVVSPGEALLGAAHLARRPARAAALARLDVGRVRPGEGTWSAGAARGLAGWVGALPLKAVERAAALAGLAAHDDEAARHAAARAMPRPGLEDFCLDKDARVARSAVLRWVGSEGARSASDARLLAVLTKSQQPWVAHEAARAAAGGARRGGDRSGAGEWLASGWGAGEAGQRAAAAARRRGDAGSLGPALRALAASADVRAAASAATALGDDASRESGEVLHGLLAHADSRVRANAAEALARRARRSGGALPPAVIELKDDPHHRVRANAWRAIIVDGDAEPADGVSAMLRDARADHRLAGVWLASRLIVREGAGGRWGELAGRVVEVSRGDDDARVRRRARSAAACVLARTGEDWASREGGMEGSG